MKRIFLSVVAAAFALAANVQAQYFKLTASHAPARMIFSYPDGWGQKISLVGGTDYENQILRGMCFLLSTSHGLAQSEMDLGESRQVLVGTGMSFGRPLSAWNSPTGTVSMIWTNESIWHAVIDSACVEHFRRIPKSSQLDPIDTLDLIKFRKHIASATRSHLQNSGYPLFFLEEMGLGLCTLETIEDQTAILEKLACGYLTLPKTEAGSDRRTKIRRVLSGLDMPTEGLLKQLANNPFNTEPGILLLRIEVTQPPEA